MGKKVVIGLSILLCLFLIDLLVRKCAAYQTDSWSIDRKVNPVETANLLLTVGITVWLSVFVSKKLSAERYEKEFLISDIREIESLVRLIQNHAYDGNVVELQTMINLNSKLKASVSRFFETTSLFEISVNSRPVNQCWAVLYRATTDVDGNEVAMRDRKVLEIHTCCNEFVLQLRKIMKLINLR